MTIYKTIARRIAEIRLNRGWSQTAVAQACGWSQTRLSGYEQATRKISIDDATTLSRALGVNPVELIFGDVSALDALTGDQRELLNVYKRLPAAEQVRMLELFKMRLNEIENYVAEYLKNNQSSKKEADF